MREKIEKTYRGEVIQVLWAPGSKSEHKAACLELKDGKRLRFRRLGGHPFSDPIIDALLGKRVKATGEVVHGNTLIASSWEEMLPAK